MNRTRLVLIIGVFLISTPAYGQSLARLKLANAGESLSSTEPKDNIDRDDQAVASRVLAGLKRLNERVVISRSLGDFEEHGKLARVSIKTLKSDLQEVSSEVEPLISSLADGSLKNALRNALDSYRDGAFWWQKIDQRHVVHASVLTSFEATRTASDTALMSSVPYTVAIHWRQADKYLRRAEEIVNHRPRYVAKRCPFPSLLRKPSVLRSRGDAKQPVWRRSRRASHVEADALRASQQPAERQAASADVS